MIIYLIAIYLVEILLNFFVLYLSTSFSELSVLKILIYASTYFIFIPFFHAIFIKKSNEYFENRTIKQFKQLNERLYFLDNDKMYSFDVLKNNELILDALKGKENSLKALYDFFYYAIMFIGIFLYTGINSVYLVLLLVLASLLLFLVYLYFERKNYDFLIGNVDNEIRSNYYRDLLLDKDTFKELTINDYSNKIADKSFHYFKTGIRSKYELRRKNSLIYNLSRLIISIIIVALCISIFAFQLATLDSLILVLFAIISIVGYGENAVESFSEFLSHGKYKKILQTKNRDDDFPTVHFDIKDFRNIVFENVSYKYKGSNNYALKDVSFKIENTDRICLLGENGSGKTTFILLLIGVLNPTKGRVLINGIPVNQINKHDLFNAFSICFQDSAKFQDTIENNVTFGKELDSRKRIIKKYNNNKEIGNSFFENGIDLSGGEWQTIFLNRALFRHSKISIFDEPTISLDSESESIFYSKLSKFYSSLPVVFVTHKIGYSNIADKILVFEDGILKEVGSKEELLEKGGIYKKLYDKQKTIVSE